MTSEIRNLIMEYEKEGDFTYASISNAQIDEAQGILSLTLPSQYVEFLQTYGHGGIGGIEIIGVGKDGRYLFVDETMKYREYGLSENFVVIENCDEWVYCLDTNDGSVVSWSDNCVDPAYTDFDSYLLDRFMDAVENM